MAQTPTSITCPKCDSEFELNKAITDQVRKTVETDLRKEFQQKEELLQAKQKKIIEQEKDLEVRQAELGAQVDARVREKEKQLEKDLKKRTEELEARAQARIDEAIQQARKQAEADIKIQMKRKDDELQERRDQLNEYRTRETDLYTRLREAEEAKAESELRAQRELAEARDKLIQQTKNEVAEAYRLRLREQDDKIKRLTDRLAEAQRQAEQGSQERQGEALEAELIDSLRLTFPTDLFEEVDRGVRGADILQTVRNSTGRICGKILWESKNTKNFDRNWLAKLREDQHKAGADISVLVSVAMPDNIEVFDLVEEIWVTNFRSSICLCSVLRQTILNVDRQRVISKSQSSMRDSIYEYVTGKEFTSCLKRIFETYETMQGDLDKEKRAIQKLWKKRETEITKVLDGIISIQGDLHALVGQTNALPAFEPLQLEAIVTDQLDDEDDSDEPDDTIEKKAE